MTHWRSNFFNLIDRPGVMDPIADYSSLSSWYREDGSITPLQAKSANGGSNYNGANSASVHYTCQVTIKSATQSRKITERPSSSATDVGSV